MLDLMKLVFHVEIQIFVMKNIAVVVIMDVMMKLENV